MLAGIYLGGKQVMRQSLGYKNVKRVKQQNEEVENVKF